MKSVLIVDDEKIIRETIAHYVSWKELGITDIYESKNGLEASALIQEKRPDILITDIKMPHIDGIRLAQDVRKQFPKIRLIFISGHTDKEYLKEAIHLRVDGYIEKPLNLDEIYETIKKIKDEYEKTLANTSSYAFFYEDSSPSVLNQKIYKLSRDTIAELGNCFKTGSRTTVLNKLQTLYEQIKTCESTPPEYIRNIYSQLASLLETAAQFHYAHKAQEKINHFVYEATTARSLKSLHQGIIQHTVLLFDEIESRDFNPVKLVDEYIQNNYKDCMITVEKIARNLNFNTSYLCTIYKQRTGQTINATLTDIRIKKAQQLLKETNYKLYEIGSLVGYSNGKYFTKIFTKKTGIPPRVYRGIHHE